MNLGHSILFGSRREEARGRGTEKKRMREGRVEGREGDGVRKDEKKR